MSKFLSPQARRRFDHCLHGRELIDLTAEIAEALEEASDGALVLGEFERGVIFAALKGEES